MALLSTFITILVTYKDPSIASERLQDSLNNINKWLKKWRLNETKSVQIIFTLKHKSCPPVSINDVQIPQSNEAKYLGMHLDNRLAWKKHIVSVSI